jgi:hypothetical protein
MRFQRSAPKAPRPVITETVHLSDELNVAASRRAASNGTRCRFFVRAIVSAYDRPRRIKISAWNFLAGAGALHRASDCRIYGHCFIVWDANGQALC